jgi:glycine hydroxymethyltransferase
MIIGGIRVGSPAMTSRGLVEADFGEIASLIDRGVGIAKQVQANIGG